MTPPWVRHTSLCIILKNAFPLKCKCQADNVFYAVALYLLKFCMQGGIIYLQYNKTQDSGTKRITRLITVRLQPNCFEVVLFGGCCCGCGLCDFVLVVVLEVNVFV